MMADSLIKCGTLKLRIEGAWWNAYYALPDAAAVNWLLLGSIQMRAVENQARKAEFMALMREVVGDIVENATGIRPVWPDPPERGPEHERSGRA